MQFENDEWENGTAYSATAVSYVHKILIKSATGGNLIKLFYSALTVGHIKLAFPSNIRHGRKRLTVTNTLAYSGAEIITAVKVL